MRAQLYSLARRSLTQSTRNRIKSWQVDLRRAGAPLLRSVYGTFNSEDLLQHLRQKLPPDFDVLFVHSSMDGLYPMFTDTGFEVLAVLRRLVGEDSTLAMPAFFFDGDNYTPEKRYALDPVFNARRTPAETGLVCELFRRSKGVHRSLHPTHSVCALGPLAEELTADHHAATSTFGAGTPFDRLNRLRTVILGIGTEFFRCLTHIHNAEDLLGADLPGAPASMTETPVTIVSIDGRRFDYVLRTPPRDGRSDRLRIDLLRQMMSPAQLREWRFHGAPFFTVEAVAVRDTLIEQAHRGKTLYVGP